MVQLEPFKALTKDSASDQAKLIMSSAAPKTTALLRARGYDVTTVDISEFEVSHSHCRLHIATTIAADTSS